MEKDKCACTDCGCDSYDKHPLVLVGKLAVLALSVMVVLYCFGFVGA